MNRETAVDLVRNLLERARESGEKTFVTSREIVALGIILEDSEGSEPAKEKGSLTAPNIAAADIAADTLLCIDFGTSFSKAFACLDTGEAIPEIIDLPIGDGGSGSQLLTPSEMIIEDDTIYFGAHARKVFDDTEAAPERLIDSIKQYMTLGADVSNLAKIRMDTAKDAKQRFFQRDILLLYLAHLTRLTENALASKGVTVNVRRRFAHPAWADGHRQSNEQAMKTMMAEAIVLARSLGDQLLKSLPVAEARAALDELKLMADALPVNLVAEPVREATAAGAGALIGSAPGKREDYIIVDIGAGTTDVAGFICVNNPDWERPRISEITSAAGAINSAGYVLDNALIKLILEKSNAMSGSTEYGRSAAALARTKRINKETLFQTSRLSVDLPTGEVVEVVVEEFLAYPPVVAFAEKVSTLVAKAADAMASERLILVATGGGAKLPIMQKLAAEGLHYEGRRFIFISRDPAPRGMAAEYPDLVDPYPQIAVALGGSLPQLPEQMVSLKTGPGPVTERRPRHAEVIYKR
jgi:molecular chaperone DnaK (HSP70)